MCGHQCTHTGAKYVITNENLIILHPSVICNGYLVSLLCLYIASKSWLGGYVEISTQANIVMSSEHITNLEQADMYIVV